MKTPGAFFVALELIRNYHGDQPLHLYLKHQFRSRRNFGSRDRRLYSDLVFGWYRTGHWMNENPELKLTVSAVLMGLDLKYPKALSSISDHPLVGLAAKESVEERLKWLQQRGVAPQLSDVFPALASLSNGFSLQLGDLFTLPFTWFRLPDSSLLSEFETTLDELTGWTALRTISGTNLDELLSHSHPDFVIQDFSSQVASALIDVKKGNKVWDCCAGSGGKSLFIADRFPGAFTLWASDVRESILRNIEKRFSGRMTKPEVFQMDLEKSSVAKESFMVSPDSMDLVLADVPCSGSGTWRRNPEQLVFFDPARINEYADLQFKIVKNALPALKTDGHLYYMTCSVYSEENEKNISRFESELSLKCVEMHFIDKLSVGADAMFVAKLRRI